MPDRVHKAPPAAGESDDDLADWLASRDENWASPGKPFVNLDIAPLPEAVRNCVCPSTISCWICQNLLPRQSLLHKVQVGHRAFLYDDVPGYRCLRCQETYLPEAVFVLIGVDVERRLAQLGPYPNRTINPRRIRATS
ncbi:MAG: hypothetical protein ACYDCQ_18095 [Dehalococcoidia bacterium]